MKNRHIWLCSIVLLSSGKAKAQTTLNTTFGYSTTITDPTSITLTTNFFASASVANSYNFVAKIGDVNYQNAPNSYIYDPAKNIDNDGIIIPIKKAFAMWQSNPKLNNKTLGGKMTATVYWQDVPGLIRTGTNYSLEISDANSIEWAKIKVPIDKSKGYGNAVVALHMGAAGTTADPVVWSWHVWVTDDPTTNGASFGHTDDSNLPLEFVNDASLGNPKFTPTFMDRNLGAVSSKIVGDKWQKAGGLMYQWGRKDPFPPLVYRDDSFYELSGETGNRIAAQYTMNYPQLITDVSSNIINNVKKNISTSVQNPLSMMVDKVYTNTSTPINSVAETWFGGSSTDNLWSDNNQGNVHTNNAAKGYLKKSPFDPCPNRWRMPSVLNNRPSNAYSDGNYLRYNPFGQNKKANYGGELLIDNSHNTTKSFLRPTGDLTYYKGIQIYPILGFDLSNIESVNNINSSFQNMGVYPGTGVIYSAASYTSGTTTSAKPYYFKDTHETRLWTATMANDGGSFKYNPMQVRLVPDAGNITYAPDKQNFPNLVGYYNIHLIDYYVSSSMAACRCMMDPYYAVNPNAYTNDFPEDKIPNVSYSNYTEGLNNPNSYMLPKNTPGPSKSIPISKAFSIYNQYLSDHQLPVSFPANLKLKVSWTTTSDGKATGLPLIKNLALNRQPTSLDDVKNIDINVKVTDNVSGNAVISLYDGNDTKAPALWSWHIWVPNSDPELTSNDIYFTEDDNVLTGDVINYKGFTNSANPKQTIQFMDRNLGAVDAFPTISSFTANANIVADPLTPFTANITPEELKQINNSGGMQYQWGRKDPLPPFKSPGGKFMTVNGQNIVNGIGAPYIVLQSTGIDASGNITYSATPISNVYLSNYATYASTAANKYDRIRDNLKYAVNNPLTFMYPSTNISVNDWLLNEGNAMQDRWGHGTSKSVFDPCPDNWRVPDEFHINSSKGNSPWYFGKYKPTGADPLYYGSLGQSQNTAIAIAGYNGVSITDAAANRYGFQFNSSDYNIGNIPLLSSRGNIKGGSITTDLDPSSGYGTQATAFWTGALNGGINNLLEIGMAKSFTITHNYQMTVSAQNNPFKAMNVRCVKVDPMINTVIAKQNKPIEEQKTQATTQPDEKLFPIPFREELHINSSEEFNYLLYDMTGSLVSSGEFENQKVNLSHLIQGTYIIKLTNYSKNRVITKKIIKN